MINRMKSTTNKAKEKPLPPPYSRPIYTTTFNIEYAYESMGVWGIDYNKVIIQFPLTWYTILIHMQPSTISKRPINDFKIWRNLI